MPDELTLNKKLGLIEIRSHGVVTKEDIESSIAWSEEALIKHGISKLIVDTTQQDEMPGTLNVFKIFSNFPKKLSAALIINEKQNTISEIGFAETVALNRGINVKLFFNREEAIEWLNEK